MNVSSHSLRRLRLRGITALVGTVTHSTSSCSPSPSSSSPPQAFLWQPARWHSSNSSNSNSSSTQAREDAAAAVLPMLQKHFDKSSFQEIVSYVDDRFDASKQNFLTFCRSECDARDTILLLMRAYTALGRMDKVRHIFVVALRDLQAVEVSTTPSSITSGIKGRRGGSGKALAMDNAPLIPAASSSSINGKEAIVWTRPSLLNVGLFNGYLEVLTRRKNYDAAEAMWVLAEMKEAGVEPDALTYHYLMEIQVRAGYDPKGLWDEAMGEHHLQPLPATVQMLLSRVVPSSTDAAFVVAVTREALRYGAAVMDKRMMVELIGQWLQQRAGASSASSTSSSSITTPVGGAVLYPPEYVMWLILELEMRCLLDKSSFAHYIQRQQLAELLLRCAKAADSVTASQLLALMDRHAMSRTADILSLVVWCWAQALELDKAFGVVEVMARKGYLELTDPFKRHHIECLRYGMDKHFLMILADAVSTPAALDKLLVHFAERRRQGLPVSVHALDVLVLAAGKMGAERRALHLVSTYESTWGVRPRTNTFNCLLVGCSAHRGGAMHDLVYEEMLKAGVAPSPQTFRVLIRQAVLNDDVDTAVKYLQEVTKRAGLRVEVEMILPILERAARAGDGDTVNRISKYALDCDIGIDGAVLQTVMKCLTDAGQSVEVLRGHQPLHEALRSRSKVGRQRARNELLL